MTADAEHDVDEMMLHARTPEARQAYIEGWNAAIASAARAADEWDHHGDTAKAMYAAVQIRDRINRLRGVYDGGPIR